MSTMTKYIVLVYEYMSIFVDIAAEEEHCRGASTATVSALHLVLGAWRCPITTEGRP